MHWIDSPLLNGVSETELEALKDRKYIAERIVPRDGFIFHQGDTPEAVYLLMEGEVSVQGTDIEGNRIIMTRFKTPGDVFAEVFAFLGGKKYPYDAVAKSPVRILVMKNKLWDVATADEIIPPQLIANMLNILAEKAAFLNRKLYVLGQPSLREKILVFLQDRKPRGDWMEMPFNREEWADYLHVTRPSLSRELSRMQNEGLIEMEKKRIRIVHH